MQLPSFLRVLTAGVLTKKHDVASKKRRKKTASTSITFLLDLSLTSVDYYTWSLPSSLAHIKTISRHVLLPYLL